MKTTILVLLVLALLVLPGVIAAVDFNQGLTAEEKQSFDGILAPVMKIYKFVQYAGTIVGVLMLVFSGISFAISGGDIAKKEKAKNMGVGVVIGLVLIWVAPLIVQALVK